MVIILKTIYVYTQTHTHTHTHTYIKAFYNWKPKKGKINQKVTAFTNVPIISYSSKILAQT